MAVLICKNPNASSVATLAEPHYLVKITHGLGHCASKYYHLEILSPPNCELFTTAVCALPHLTWHRRVEDDDVIESILRNSFLVNCPWTTDSSVWTRNSRGSMALEMPKNLASSRTPEVTEWRSIEKGVGSMHGSSNYCWWGGGGREQYDIPLGSS